MSKPFSDFTPVSSILPTDNLVGWRSSLAPGLQNIQSSASALFSSISTPSQTVWVNDTYGVDSTGKGNELNPYQSLTYALSQITDASEVKPYLIDLQGNFSYTDLALKPNIYYRLNNSVLSVTNPVTADAAWSSGGILIFDGGFLDVEFGLDFQAVNAPFAIIEIKNPITLTNKNWLIQGNPEPNSTIVILENVIGITGQPSITLNECYGGASFGAPASLTLNVSAGTRVFNISSEQFLGNLAVNLTNTASLLMNLDSTKINGTAEYSNTGSGTLQMQVTNTVETSAPTLTNGVGGVFTYQYDKFRFNPVVTGIVNLQRIALPPTFQEIYAVNPRFQTIYSSPGPFKIGNFMNIDSFIVDDDATFKGFNITNLITADSTIDKYLSGFINQSDDLAVYNISLVLNCGANARLHAALLTGLNNPLNVQIPPGVTLNGIDGSITPTVVIPAGNCFVTLMRIAQNDYILIQPMFGPSYSLPGAPLVITGTLLTKKELLKKLPKNLSWLNLDKATIIQASAVHTLQNPTPSIIAVFSLTEDVTITMPAVNSSLACGYLGMPYLYNADTTFNLIVNDVTSSNIGTIPPFQAAQMLLFDNSTPAGSWISPRPDLINLGGLSGQVGIVSPGSTINVNFNSATNNVELDTAGGGSTPTLQQVYDASGITPEIKSTVDFLEIQDSSGNPITDWIGGLFTYKGGQVYTQLAADINMAINGGFYQGRVLQSADDAVHTVTYPLGTPFPAPGISNTFFAGNIQNIDFVFDPAATVNGVPGYNFSITAPNGGVRIQTISRDNYIAEFLPATVNMAVGNYASSDGVINILDNGNGTWSAPIADLPAFAYARGNYSVINNGFTTTLPGVNSFVPLTINPTSFSTNGADDGEIIAEMYTILGVNTPCFRRTVSPSRPYKIDLNISVKNASTPVSIQTYIVQLYKIASDGVTVTPLTYQSPRVTVPTLGIDCNISIPITGFVNLTLNERVFAQIQNVVSGTSPIVQDINAAIVLA